MKLGSVGFAAVLLLISGLSSPALGDFLRGDADMDGKVDVTDAITLLRALFQSGGAIGCEDAADSNDDGKVAIDDAVSTLRFLFAEGYIPSPGAFAAGPDPSCDRLGCAAAPDLAPAVLLSEIQYNPAATQVLEYVELHNRTSLDVSLADYRITGGINFDFPADSVIPANGFLLLLRDPNNLKWRKLTVPKLGPYEGSLADGGERLTLVDGDCEVETVKYDDRAPWPVGADGSGSSLERVDYLVSAEDYHAWRTSTTKTGSPGAESTTAGTPAWPLIAFHSFVPAEPTSQDSVAVGITFDAPPQSITRVTLRYEAVAAVASPPATTEMSVAESGEDWTTFAATLPPQASQSLVRMDVEVALADGRTTVLPPPAEPQAFLSYFVYDREMPAKLPILWLFPKRKTGLPLTGRSVSAAVVLDPDGDPPLSPRPVPQVFDGADVRVSRQGQKVKFLKGEELRGNRQVNVALEEGGGGTGSFAPHMEQLGFKTFRDLGAIAPRSDWFRVVDYSSTSKRHSQREVIEEIDERFLENNGLDPGGDLYKYVYQGTEKHTNPETGMVSLNQLISKLRSPNAATQRNAVLNELDLENVGLYSVVGVLIANWDGFHNNVYIYKDLSPGGLWKVIPWDLDQVFEVGCAEMPVTRPLTGEGCNAREPGVISHPFHLQPELDAAYREELRAQIGPGGLFTVERMTAEMDSIEALLNADLDLQEAYIGSKRVARRTQIHSAYTAMRTYMTRRVAYLERVLGN